MSQFFLKIVKIYSAEVLHTEFGDISAKRFEIRQNTENSNVLWQLDKTISSPNATFSNTAKIVKL